MTRCGRSASTGAGGDFCAGADWVATNDRRRSAPDRRPRPPHPAHREPGDRTPRHDPPAGGLPGARLGGRAGLQPRAGCRLHRRRRRTRRSGNRSSSRGFSPDSGATWLLPRLAGVARAKRMLLLGEKVSGAEAADWGLIHDAVTPAERRARRRRSAGPAGLGAHGRDRTGQAGDALRPARHAEPVDERTNSRVSNYLAGQRISKRAWPHSGSVAHPTSRVR